VGEPLKRSVGLLLRFIMKTSFTHFSPNAAVRDHYQRGVDYLEHNFDLEFDDTLYLLRELRNHRSSLSVTAPKCHLNFYVESDGSLRVEIDGVNGSLGRFGGRGRSCCQNPPNGFRRSGVREIHSDDKS